MGRFRIGVGLLAALLAVALGAQFGMAAAQKPVEEALKQSLAAAEAGDFDGAKDAVLAAWEAWDGSRTLCAALADHQFLEDVESNLAMLAIWAREQEKADFSALCAETILRVKAVAAAHKLNLATFF